MPRPDHPSPARDQRPRARRGVQIPAPVEPIELPGARVSGHIIILCTHGELLADLLRVLAANGVIVADALVWPKGSTWIMQQAEDGPLRWAAAGHEPAG